MVGAGINPKRGLRSRSHGARVALLALAGAGFGGCHKQATPVVGGPAATYVELMNKTPWTSDDKGKLVNLFTIRGLNRFIDVHGAKSFRDLETRTRSSLRPAYGDRLSLVRMFEADVPRGEMPANGRAVAAVWKQTGDGDPKFFLARFVFVEDRATDFQLRDAKRSFELTGVSFAAGSVLLVLMIVLLVRFRRNGAIALVVLGMVMGKVGKEIAKSGELRGIFATDVYDVSDGGPFVSPAVSVPGPFPAPDEKDVWAGARALVAEDLGTLEIASTGSPDRDVLAKSYRDLASQAIHKAVIKEYETALVALSKALAARFDYDTVAEIAGVYSALAHLGVSPQLNAMRAAAILSEIPTGKSAPRDARTAALAVVNLLRRGKPTGEDLAAAGRKLDEAREKAGDKSRRDEWLLTAAYFRESNPAKRLAVAEDLIRASPNSALYYFYQGTAAQAAGNADLAKASLDRAAAMSPSFTAARDRAKQGDALDATQPVASVDWRADVTGAAFGRLWAYADLVRPPGT